MSKNKRRRNTYTAVGEKGGERTARGGRGRVRSGGGREGEGG